MAPVTNIRYELERFDRRAAWQEDHVPNLRMVMVMALVIVMVIVVVMVMALVMVMLVSVVMVMLVVVVVTEVLGKETMCLTIIAKATLSSRRANLIPSTLLLMSHPNRGFLAHKWVTHHFWEIHICRAAPLSINAILPICEGLVAARMTLCAVVNTSHPHIPETHQESRMEAFVG